MGHAASTCQKSFTRIVTNCQERVSAKRSQGEEKNLEVSYKVGKERNNLSVEDEGFEKTDLIVCESIPQRETSVPREYYLSDKREVSVCNSDSHTSGIFAELDVDISKSDEESFSICRKFSTRSKSVPFEKYLLSNRSHSDLESPTESEDRTIILDNDDFVPGEKESGKIANFCSEMIDNFNTDLMETDGLCVSDERPTRDDEEDDLVAKKSSLNVKSLLNSLLREGSVLALKSDDPVVMLERKQEDIFRRLEKLKATVVQLQQRYGEGQTTPAGGVSSVLGSTNAAKGSSPASTDFGGVVHDIVINADPDNVPLSLFILTDALQKKYRLKGTTHIHSSVSSVPEKWKKPFEENGNNIRKDRGLNQIIITLIWKKVDHTPELMVSVHNQTPIQGEVNIARYLARLLDPAFDSGDICQATQIDEWLDLAMTQLLNGNNKEKAASLRTLNSKLGRNDWLVGSGISLADIVMWSVIHQTNQVADVPANVKKWLNACNQSDTFKRVKSFIC